MEYIDDAQSLIWTVKTKMMKILKTDSVLVNNYVNVFPVIR